MEAADIVMLFIFGLVYRVVSRVLVYLGLGILIGLAVVDWEEHHCPSPHFGGYEVAVIAMGWGFFVPWFVVGEAFWPMSEVHMLVKKGFPGGSKWRDPTRGFSVP